MNKLAAQLHQRQSTKDPTTNTMAPTHPIRVGFIGLSAHYAWANISHLPALVNSPHYTIHGILNSTPAASEAAIKAHNLPQTTKAYTSIRELAQDPDIDLVVVSVFVGHHYEYALQAVQNGKDVFVEWPLATNGAEAEELAKVAREKKVRTVIGLQARKDPLVAKLREIIDSGKIGQVQSTSLVAAMGFLDGTAPKWMIHAADSKVYDLSSPGPLTTCGIVD
jgi:predicted dehydrogenase